MKIPIMELRKISIFVDDVLSEGGRKLLSPTRRVPRVGLSETPSLANRQVGVSLGHLDRAVTQ